MKIHDFPGFPNPLRVRMALAEKRILDAAEFVLVDVPAGAHRRAEFLAMNPSGTVPVLELDDGTVISECTAITEYLDHLDGVPSLTGTSPRQRGLIHMMNRRAEAGLLDAVAAYFHHATAGLGPEIEIWQNREWGEHNRDRTLLGMVQFDRVLRNQPWIAGEDFSMADITAFAGLAFADFVQLAVPEECAALAAWKARVAARPTTIVAMGTA